VSKDGSKGDVNLGYDKEIFPSYKQRVVFGAVQCYMSDLISSTACKFGLLTFQKA